MNQFVQTVVDTITQTLTPDFMARGLVHVINTVLADNDPANVNKEVMLGLTVADIQKIGAVWRNDELFGSIAGDFSGMVVSGFYAGLLDEMYVSAEDDMSISLAVGSALCSSVDIAADQLQDQHPNHSYNAEAANAAYSKVIKLIEDRTRDILNALIQETEEDYSWVTQPTHTAPHTLQ